MRTGLLLLLLCGCAGTASSPDSGQPNDGGGPVPDAGTPPDSGTEPDAGEFDAGAHDAGQPPNDGGPYDQSFITRSRTYPGVNGWFPSISPDGKYLLCGFGELWGVDLTTDATQHLMARSYHGQWIDPSTGTFVREDNATGSLSTRLEVDPSTWAVTPKADDQTLVAASLFRASGGHWASWIAGAGRITWDGAAIVMGAGGALTVDGDAFAHAIITNGEYRGVRHWVGGVAVHDYPTRTPQEAHEISLGGGYLAYGGYGPIHGITPAGVDTDLSIAPWRWEARPQVLMVSGQPWLVTTSFHVPSNRGLIFLRPWGETNAIVLEDGDAAGLHTVVSGNQFIFAMNDPMGRLIVRTFPVSSPRVPIRP